MRGSGGTISTLEVIEKPVSSKLSKYYTK